jgi:predicted nucleic acid-binding protein
VSVFIDTPCDLRAVLDRDDRFHDEASTAWRALLRDGVTLVTSDYVLVECHALVQRRLGVDAMRALATQLIPALKSEWVSEADHEVAQATLVATGRHDVSLVDFSSFQVMRRTSLRRAFTFDAHFSEQGFEVLPGG